MTDPYRACLAELLSKIDYTWGDIPADVRDLMDRARALLAQPEPEGPTDEELMAVFWEHENGLEELWAADWPTAARAALAKWGHQ